MLYLISFETLCRFLGCNLVAISSPGECTLPAWINMLMLAQVLPQQTGGQLRRKKARKAECKGSVSYCVGACFIVCFFLFDLYIGHFIISAFWKEVKKEAVGLGLYCSYCSFVVMYRSISNKILSVLVTIVCSTIKRTYPQWRRSPI